MILSWLVNVSWLVILANFRHIPVLQMFSTAAFLVMAHLKLCKSLGQHSDFCCFRGVTYVAVHCVLN